MPDGVLDAFLGIANRSRDRHPDRLHADQLRPHGTGAMSKKTCSCNNPKCPNSPTYNACTHCMCLTSPEFPPSGVLGWGGPIYKVCCKCSYQVPISSTWGQQWLVNFSNANAAPSSTIGTTFTEAIGKPLP